MLSCNSGVCNESRVKLAVLGIQNSELPKQCTKRREVHNAKPMWELLMIDGEEKDARWTEIHECYAAGPKVSWNT